MKFFIVFTAIMAVSSAVSIGDFIEDVFGKTVNKTEGVVGGFLNVVDKTKDVVGGFIDTTKDVVRGTFNSVRGTLDQALDHVGGFMKWLKGIPGQLVENGDGENETIEEINDIVKKLIAVIGDLANGVCIGKTGNEVGEEVGDLVEKFIDDLMNLVDNIRNGAQGTENKMEDGTINKVVEGLVALVRKFEDDLGKVVIDHGDVNGEINKAMEVLKVIAEELETRRVKLGVEVDHQ